MRPVHHPDDVALTEDEQSSLGSVPRQGERRLFDFGADEPWEPPANAPAATLPPWLKQPEQESVPQAEQVAPEVEVQAEAAQVEVQPRSEVQPRVRPRVESPVDLQAAVPPGSLPAQGSGRRRRRAEPVEASPLVVPMMLMGAPTLPPAPAVLDRIVEVAPAAEGAVPVAAPAVVTSAGPPPVVAPVPLAVPLAAPPKAPPKAPLKATFTPVAPPKVAPRPQPVVLEAPVAVAKPAVAKPAVAKPAAAKPAAAKPAAAKPAPQRRPRRAGLLVPAVVLGVLAAVGGVSLLDGTGTGAEPDAAAGQARDWVLANLDLSITVLAPNATARDLTAHGLDHDRVVGYGDASSDKIDADCCSFLVVTGSSGAKAAAALPPPVRQAYDRSRATASFQVGGRHAEVRQILDMPARDVAASVASDRRILAAAGRELADNDRLKLSDKARTTLLAGGVDPRVAVAMVSVTGAHKVTVSDFPAGPGEENTGSWRRSVVITRIDGSAATPGGSKVKAVKSLLAGQKSPYRPAATSVDADGGTLTITFRAPSPLGLLESVR